MPNEELLSQIHSTEVSLLDELDRVCETLGLTYFLSCGTLLGSVRHQGFIPWDEDLDVMMPREDYEIFVEMAPQLLGESFRLDDHTTNPLYFNPFAKLRLKNTLFAIKALNGYRGGQEFWLDIFPMDDCEGKDDPLLAKRSRTIGLMRAAICTARGIGKMTDLSQKQQLIVKVLHRLPEKCLWATMKKAHEKGKGDCYVLLDTDYDCHRLVMPKSWFGTAKGTFEGNRYTVPSNSDAVLTTIYGDYMTIPPKEKQVTFYPQKIQFPGGAIIEIKEEQA